MDVLTVQTQLDENPKHFMLLGNGDGGTSMTRGLLNAHPKIECLFEHKGGTSKNFPPGEMEVWKEMAREAEKREMIWGNKVPVEQFITRHYTTENVVQLADHFKIVFLIRRYSKYWKHRKPVKVYENNWVWTHELYNAIREKWVTRVIQVSFEDLVIRPVIELTRICGFLGVEYEPAMLKGTMDTGLSSYNQNGINMEKA